MNTQVWCCQGRRVFCDCIAIYESTKQLDTSHGARLRRVRTSIPMGRNSQQPQTSPRVHACAENRYADKLSKLSTLGLLTNSPLNSPLQNKALIDAQNRQKLWHLCRPGLKTSTEPVCNTGFVTRAGAKEACPTVKCYRGRHPLAPVLVTNRC
jgi:hypothetical protein